MLDMQNIRKNKKMKKGGCLGKYSDGRR
jgi:hypothetical protein